MEKTIYRQSPSAKILKFNNNYNNLSDTDIISMLLGIIKLVRQDERQKVITELKTKLAKQIKDEKPFCF